MSVFLTSPKILDPHIVAALTLACIVMLIIFLVQRELTAADIQRTEGFRHTLRMIIVPLLIIFGILLVRTIAAAL